MYVARLRNVGKTSIRAEPHNFYVYRQYTNIVFILQ